MLPYQQALSKTRSRRLQGQEYVTEFKGREGTAVEGIRAAGVITESVPMSELMALKPLTAPVGIETILGFDSRDGYLFGRTYQVILVVPVYLPCYEAQETLRLHQ